MRYAGTRRSETNPLRSVPLFQPADRVMRQSAPLPSDLNPKPCPAHFLPPPNQEQLVRELANAEAALVETMRVYDAARAGIGEANRTHTAQSSAMAISSCRRSATRPSVSGNGSPMPSECSTSAAAKSLQLAVGSM